jgi:E3 ubiquitin-protein ligase MARCH6
LSFGITILSVVCLLWNCSIFDPFTEIPVDVLLFQICIPFAIEHFKPRATIKSLLHHWFAVVGWGLGLTDFLLPKPEENGGQENWNGRAERRDRGHGGQEMVAPQVEQLMIQHVAAEHNDRGNANEANDVTEESDVDDQGDSE